jgi:hypothetical protein
LTKDTYYSRNRERLLEKSKQKYNSIKSSPEWFAKKRKSRREIDLKHRYGISLEHYELLYFQQEGLCAICNKPPELGLRGGKLFVDHDHDTNVVRGLLCFRCNSALGLLLDNPETALKASEYLRIQHI